MRSLGEQLYHPLHAAERIHLARMGGKGGHADTQYAIGRRRTGNAGQREALRGVCLHGEAQPRQCLGIAGKGRGLLGLHLGMQEGASCPAPLIDMCHGLSRQAETQTEVLGAQDIVQVAYVGGLQGCQLVIELAQADAVRVDTPKRDIRRELLHDAAHVGAAHHGDVHVGIAPGQGIDDGNGHQDVAQRRETDEEKMCVGHHFFPYRMGFVSTSLYIFICL